MREEFFVLIFIIHVAGPNVIMVELNESGGRAMKMERGFLIIIIIIMRLSQFKKKKKAPRFLEFCHAVLCCLRDSAMYCTAAIGFVLRARGAQEPKRCVNREAVLGLRSVMDCIIIMFKTHKKHKLNAV